MAYVRRRETKTGQVRYEVRYRGPDKRERCEWFARKVDANRRKVELENALQTGNWVDPRRGRVTLRSYAATWLDSHPSLQATTHTRYQGLLDLHLLPTLGDWPMARLQPESIRAWYAELRRQHAATAAGAYRLLATICRTAVEEGVIARTPCRVSGAGVERAEERPMVSPEDVAAAVSAAPERWQAAILLAAWCQLRRGEVLGLQRGDVNPLRGEVAIRRTWTASGEGPPKTDAGRRTVAMPAQVSAAVSQHLERHVEPDADAWLFPGRNGKPVVPRSLDRIWENAREVAGLDGVRLHDLRHAGLTWTAQAGASVAELMHRAGHASAAAALRYQHATQERDRALAQELEKMARGAVAGLSQDVDGG